MTTRVVLIGGLALTILGWLLGELAIDVRERGLVGETFIQHLSTSRRTGAQIITDISYSTLVVPELKVGQV
jgi:hypothetical protein